MLRDYDAIFFVIFCTIWQVTLCLTNIFNEASAQIKCKICNHKRISRDWIVLSVLPPRWRISMPNESKVQCKRVPNSFPSKLRHGSRHRDPKPSPFICYAWRDKSENTPQHMQFTYWVASFSDHCHVSYAYAYNTLLNTHAQIASPDWNYNDTTFSIKICLC